MESAVGEPLRVLVVDGDAGFLERVAAELERSPDLTVLTETSPGAVPERLGSDAVDCVVAGDDRDGPGGLDLLSAVRETRPDLAFVLVDRDGSASLACDAIAAGVDGYVPRDPDGAVPATLADAVGTVVERTRAERSYREVFEKTAVGLLLHDPGTGEIIEANPYFYEMLGYDPSDPPELTLADVSAGRPPYTAERGRELVREAAREGERTFEWLDETRDGEHRWVEVTVRAATIGGRDLVLSAARDVSVRKARERKTRRLQRVTRDLVTAETHEEVADVAVTAAAEVVDPPFCGVYLLSDAGDALRAAATAGDRGDDGPAAFVADERATPVDDAVWNAYLNGETVVHDDVATTTDGTSRTDLGDDPVESLLVHPVGDHGTFLVAAPTPGAFAETDRSLLDILTTQATAALERAEREAALREREAELARQNERLEDFASIVSHDLRDPLEAAYGHLELAAREVDSDHHDGIRRMLSRMEDIVEDTLSLARHGQAVVEPEPVDLGRVVDVAWDTAAPHEATLRTRGDPGTIRGDRTRVGQLLENLFRNAVEHGSTSSQPSADDAVEHAGEDVTVTVGAFDDGFYVEDDGPGIPREDREQVFEVGYSTGEDGAGLGLAIVEQIAGAHGWSVAATRGSDGGARIEVTGVDRPDDPPDGG